MEITLYALRFKRDIIRPADFQVLAQNWNRVSNAIMSLLYGVTGGEDWPPLAEPFFHMGMMVEVHGTIFTLFILVTTLGLLNVLVGVFVASSNDFANVSLSAALERAISQIQ